MNTPVKSNRNRGLFFLIAPFSILVILVAFIGGRSTWAMAAQGEVFMPLFRGSGSMPLCRFGVNFVSSYDEYDTNALRLGWYIDYRAIPTRTQPDIPHYAPVISLEQVGPDSYDFSPKGTELDLAIDANHGASWLIGNEPDRVDYQNDIEPHLYARAYNELYHLIKARDSSAQIIAGNIVQPTDVRLIYLDMVLASYQDAFGVPMPVDGWGIHNFILNEQSCDLECPNHENCWGAEVPPGVDVCAGEILSISDNDNLELFEERIEKFRRWMVDRGYGGLPVFLSEYGILMPESLGFPPDRVNSFMNSTFDYLLNTTNQQLGDPNDGYRLVQRLSWYSDSDKSFNGWLFEPALPGRPLTSMGWNYSIYVNQLRDEIDLYPVNLATDPHNPDSSQGPVNVLLRATVANQGNLAFESGPVIVRFYDGDPNQGGNLIGEQGDIWLSGCGDSAVVETAWLNLTAGQYVVYVEVDSLNVIPEVDETNNLKPFLVTVN